MTRIYGAFHWSSWPFTTPETPPILKSESQVGKQVFNPIQPTPLSTWMKTVHEAIYWPLGLFFVFSIVQNLPVHVLFFVLSCYMRVGANRANNANNNSCVPLTFFVTCKWSVLNLFVTLFLAPNSTSEVNETHQRVLTTGNIRFSYIAPCWKPVLQISKVLLHPTLFH